MEELRDRTHLKKNFFFATVLGVTRQIYSGARCVLEGEKVERFRIGRRGSQKPSCQGAVGDKVALRVVSCQPHSVTGCAVSKEMWLFTAVLNVDVNLPESWLLTTASACGL